MHREGLAQICGRNALPAAVTYANEPPVTAFPSSDFHAETDPYSQQSLSSPVFHSQPPMEGEPHHTGGFQPGPTAARRSIRISAFMSSLHEFGLSVKRKLSEQLSPPPVTRRDRLEVDGAGREEWAGPFDFLVSMINFAVGLGNVWRFSYLCFKNGGGSFLVAYAIFFVFGAMPIFIMEVAIGQYLQRGAMKIWEEAAPAFKVRGG